MGRLQVLKHLLIGLSCLGLILPGTWLQAAGPGPSNVGRLPARGPRGAVHDVKLDRHGILRGMVVNAEGDPAARATVVLGQQGRELVRAETDGLGRFALGPVRGGTCQLRIGQESRLIRVWAADTAPPVAKELVLVVVGGRLVRGQLPMEKFFDSDAVVIVGLVAAMIAIPIAVHRSGGPASSD